ncbi:MAG TPA: patatin-like phospholipase family protein [Spongiibacteraceae bacterium]|nr:patatin-like phospholipase family protein [Spongiibacteraceae bacterium]
MADGSSEPAPKVGLILSGGGARAAYQVGVLQAIARMLPADAPNPFAIICGTSAGAINAATLACNADRFRYSVAYLLRLWSNIHADHVYRADVWGLVRNTLRWFGAVMFGGFGKGKRGSLLDSAPLRKLLKRTIDFAGIGRAIDSGDLDALCITASGYSSNESISFFQGKASLSNWRRARRIGCKMPIEVQHLLASSAIPFVFPPVLVDREYFGDGAMQQLAPTSPALHLGAERILIIGVGKPLDSGARIHAPPFPSLAQIAGHVLDSVFIDSLEADIERLQRVNKTLAAMPADAVATHELELRPIAALVIRPSIRINEIAAQHAQYLPRGIRFLLHGIGGMRHSGANVISYLLFERPFCRALIKLGYADAMAKREDILAFLGQPLAASSAVADEQPGL